MSCNLQLQRDTEVFFSTVDLLGGAAVGSMTPQNTWKVEVLAGYAVSQSVDTQDITTLESGTTPDRSVQRFRTSINPVEWNFQVYIRPTGLEASSGNVTTTNNVKPVADWFLWQALISNTKPATGTAETSAWENGGLFRSVQRAGATNVAPHRPNFGSAQENYLYFRMGNIFYQLSNATVNQSTIDAAIDTIATTTWTGFATTITELVGTQRNNAVSVFGGVLNAGGAAVIANANYAALTATSAYHPWATWNVSGTAATASFIKNRLSVIDLFRANTAAASPIEYTYPVTALSWTYNNNLTYLTPEELSSLNAPIGNFAGSRQVSGSLSAYLRTGSNQTAGFFQAIAADTRTSAALTANANIKVGGATQPYLALYMPSVEFSIPTHDVQDIVGITVEYLAQESNVNCGLGDEVAIFVKK